MKKTHLQTGSPLEKKNTILSKKEKNKNSQEKTPKIQALWIDYYGVPLGMPLIMSLTSVCSGCDVPDTGSRRPGTGSSPGHP